MALLTLPEDGMIVTIDEARAELKIAQRHLYTLQALQDEAHDLTEELKFLSMVCHPQILML